MAGFQESTPSPKVDRPPFFASGSLASGVSTTISFDNITRQVVISCTSSDGDATTALLVGVTSGGVTATEKIGIPAGQTVTLDMQVKSLVLRGGGANIGYQLVAVLSRMPSADYPDLTAANGFSGVE